MNEKNYPTVEELEMVAKFDSWYKTAKIEALEEAAYTLAHWQSAEAHIGDPECEGLYGASQAYKLFEEAVEDPEQWLRDRAQKIREGELE